MILSMASKTIILASNACKELYGDVNRANHFYVNLPEVIQFPESEDWGVCLKEITFSSTIPTITTEFIQVKMHPELQLALTNFVTFTWKAGDLLESHASFTYNKKKKQYFFEFTLDISDDDFVNSVIANGGVGVSARLEFDDWAYDEEIMPLSSIEAYRGNSKWIFKSQSKKHTKPFRFESSMTFDPMLYRYVGKRIIKLNLTPGFYESPALLLTHINELVEPFDAVFGLSKVSTPKFILEKIPTTCDLILAEGLHFVLGYNKSQLDQTYTKAEHSPQLQRGIFSFFLYTDIVRETLVGDVMVPLLRTVHVPHTTYGSIVNQIIENPIVIGLNRKRISSIEIMICTDVGEFVEFEGGKVLLILEFTRL